MKRILVWLIVVVAAGFTVGVPRAQDAAKDWPARTVRIIIPLGAGGGAATGCGALPRSWFAEPGQFPTIGPLPSIER